MFAVDDDFPTSPKLEAISDWRTQALAVACWALLGAACRKRGNGGIVSRRLLDDVLHRWPARERVKAAQALVDARGHSDAGLWEAHGDGWRFHEWEVWQPTAEESSAERRASSLKAQRQRRWRQKRRLCVDGEASTRDACETSSESSTEMLDETSSNTSRDASLARRDARARFPSLPVPSREEAAAAADQHESDEPDEDESRFGPEPYAGLTQQRVAKLWHEITTHVHTGGRAAMAFAQIASVTLQRIGAANAERAVRIGFLWLSRAPQGPHCAGTLKILAPWTVADRWSNDLDNAQAWWNSGGREWWREHDPKRSGEAAQ